MLMHAFDNCALTCHSESVGTKGQGFALVRANARSSTDVEQRDLQEASQAIFLLPSLIAFATILHAGSEDVMQVRVERGGEMANRPENIVVTTYFRPGLRDRTLELGPADAELFFRQFGKALGNNCPCCRDKPQVWNDRDGRWEIVR